MLSFAMELIKFLDPVELVWQANCNYRLIDVAAPAGVPPWSILMSILSQIQNTRSQRNSIDKGATAESLVFALRETERALQESIKAEEERTGLHEYNDPQYSMLARSM